MVAVASFERILMARCGSPTLFEVTVSGTSTVLLSIGLGMDVVLVPGRELVNSVAVLKPAQWMFFATHLVIFCSCSMVCLVETKIGLLCITYSSWKAAALQVQQQRGPFG